MNIKGIQKTSLVDFPGRISTVVFLGGCNLSCRYCYNIELAKDSNQLTLYNKNDTLFFLKKRKGLIDGVVISGGEPTISDEIADFINSIKNIPLSVKIDTNGLKPDIIEGLIKKNLLDYISIDIKTSPQKYESLTCKTIDFTNIKKTIEIVKDSRIDYELRTTCVPEFVTLEDLNIIKNEVGHVDRYYLQQYVNEATLDPSFQEYEPYAVSILCEFRELVKTFSDICEIRGI